MEPLLIGVGHDDDEFIPAESRAHVETPDGLAQDPRDVADHHISDEVTKLIVDPLEIIDVEHKHADQRAVPARALHLLFEPQLEVTPIEEAAHRINHGGAGIGTRLPPRGLETESEGRRRGHPPKDAEIAPREGPAVDPVAHAHDGDHLVSEFQRNRHERIRGESEASRAQPWNR